MSCSYMPASWGWRGFLSERLGSRYRSRHSPDWLKFKNPQAPGVKREAEEEWGKERCGDFTANEALAISVPKSEAAVIRHFQERTSTD